MSKMIKEMELVYNKAKKLADSNIDVEMLHYAKGVEICIEIAKKHKKKKKGKCEWTMDWYSRVQMMIENKEHNGKLLLFAGDECPYKYCPYCGKKIKVVKTE